MVQTLGPTINIYMNELDEWVLEELKPKHNRSSERRGGRRPNPEYVRVHGRKHYARKKGDVETAKKYDKMMKTMPSKDLRDETFRKMAYIRYADDFLISFSGPKREAEGIKKELKEFLENRLKLKLSEQKTLITHARTEKAKFLGYELLIQHSQTRRHVNGTMRFEIPREVIQKAITKHTVNGKPVHRKELTETSDFNIIATYQAEYRGLAEYYKMAHNLEGLNKLKWIMTSALLKTLAHKHKSSVAKMKKKHQDTIVKGGKSYNVLQVVIEREGKEPLKTHFGGVPLKRVKKPTNLKDQVERAVFTNINDLLRRLEADTCEMCGEEGRIEVHHVRKLKDLKKKVRKRRNLGN